MIRGIGCMMLLCIASVCLMAGEGDVVADISRLRKEQQYASWGEYGVLERQIEQARKGASDTYVVRDIPFFTFIARLSHLLPFLFLQILFCLLLSMIFILKRGRIFIFIFLVFCGILIWGGYRERSPSWRIIRARTELYLGPGSGYPVRRSLVPGDEVRLVSLSKKNGPTWILVDAYGVKGWLPHDVIS